MVSGTGITSRTVKNALNLNTNLLTENMAKVLLFIYVLILSPVLLFIPEIEFID